MADPLIVVAFHSTGMCPTNFAMDLARALRYTGTMIPFCLHEQGCYVDSARNHLVQTFLDKTQGSHLMMIDVDMSFEPSAFMTTFNILHASGADVCFGNYSLGNAGNSIFGPPENAQKEAAVLVCLKPNMIYTDISTGGTGWVMATRGILERMRKECPGPWHWFARDLTADGKDRRGEDVSFGLRLWNMSPKPKVIATTSLVLRHLKNQPFVPDFMVDEAAKRGLPAITFPNPYLDENKFIVNGHQVIAKENLTPAQIQELEERVAALKIKQQMQQANFVGGGDSNAVGPSNEQGGSGDAAQREQARPAGEEQEPSTGDHAEREGEGEGGQEGVQVQEAAPPAEEGQPEGAEAQHA